MYICEIIRIYNSTSSIVDMLITRKNNNYKLFITDNMLLLNNILLNKIKLLPSEFSIIELNKVDFIQVNIPLQVSLDFIKKNLKCIKWVIYTSLEMQIEPKDMTTWIEYLEITNKDVVGLYLKEHQMGKGIAFNIPWNTVCAWKVTDNLVWDTSGNNGMEEYKMMIGKSIAFINIKYKWLYNNNENFINKIKTKNIRLLNSMNIKNENEIPTLLLVYVSNEII